ncbi:Putative aminopeptidase [Idiomarina sp. A28L]|uniref:M28 family peptidase n=1 Tax=Idiomarina sp. A28L TaxID=1036674 RepID=UPI000213880F|nr:M28 family peptidase [Idiomarina sp. A28L]EGN75126.1 Putative aminopeptidase [Idiomarina sp. A28L]
MHNHRSWYRRLWPLWLLIIIVILAWWPGRSILMNTLTEREAQRIASITPDQGAATTPERLSIERIMADLHWLADAEREGRAPGTDGSQAARDYIIERFQELGLTPAGTEGYEQAFTHERVERAVNILGAIEGQDPTLRTIVITAHYDHLGVRNGQIYHGSDDNASGTSVLLEMARYFSENQPQHTLLFAALDSEERGLLGAHALFTSGHLDPKTIAFNVNMDMLSRNTDELLYAVGTYHHPWLVRLVQRVQAENGARIVMAHDRPWFKAGHTDDWTLSSDHGPFHEQGIPFIYFGVADHPDYHAPTDTSDKADEAFFRITAEATLSFTKLIDQVLSEKR